MAPLPARLLGLCICIQFAGSVISQTYMLRDLAVRPAATIEELMQQVPSIFEEEKHVLNLHPKAGAVITIGDSITAYGYGEGGWVTLLKQDYPEMVFVNRGVPMGNSRSSLIISNWTLGNERSPFYKQPQRLKLVTICFGANDASTKLKDSNWRVIPEAEYKANLVTSVKLFQSQGVSNILLLTPPPAASPPRIDRRLEVTGAYAELVKEVGRQMQVPVVDVFSAIQEDPEWRTAAMLPDGLHLNTVGNRVLHEQVLAAIMASYPAL